MYPGSERDATVEMQQSDTFHETPAHRPYAEGRGIGQYRSPSGVPSIGRRAGSHDRDRPFSRGGRRKADAEISHRGRPGQRLQWRAAAAPPERPGQLLHDPHKNTCAAETPLQTAVSVSKSPWSAQTGGVAGRRFGKEDITVKAKEALVMELLREHHISQGKTADSGYQQCLSETCRTYLGKYS
jgi:hypothetical protein